MIPISSAFGPRVHPIRGTHQIHTGVDLPAPAGTPVFAARGGVVDIGEDDVGGKKVHITDGSGLRWSYLHLSAQLVRSGARVEQGAVIGRVGCTGSCTGPHLHLSVKRDGQFIDPVPLFPPGTFRRL